jgi:sarcosine oxidase subunit alpha
MSADLFQITVDGVALVVPRGVSVAAALMNAGLPLRESVRGEPRAALCGMGVCHECRLTIGGRAQQRSCLVTVEPGMIISRHA